ncbi:MAG: PD40 domain-containing protein [Bacteroidetes bacterium]|nr:PD40 domain-containing protein [Bacteroidota bacterium]
MKCVKNKILMLLLVVCGSSAFSQSKTGRKDIHKLTEEAQAYLDGEDYTMAWSAYKALLLHDPKNEVAAVNAAISLFKLNYSVDSAFVLGTTLSASKLIDAKYYLAKIKHKQHLFDEAITLLEAYKKTGEKRRLHSNEEADYLIRVCNSAKTFVSKPHKAVIKNMGAEINSVADDYVPVIMPDESALYFTSKRNGSTGGKRNRDGTLYEDVYVSYQEKGEWKKAKNIGAPINTDNNDACVAISPDGQRMIIYRNIPNQMSGDLYISTIGKDYKWQEPQRINSVINSEYFETSACFSNDTNEIYFSSNRPGGYGGKDIYRIKKLPNGKWSVPFNLGPYINSPYDDDAPFMHPDGVTLYFSSKGHNTIGDYDIFKSKLNVETNEFVRAENMGYPINDVNDDIFFVLSVDGQRGYYSSIKQESFGGEDIYQIDTRFSENDLAVKSGIILSEYNEPLFSKITLTDMESNGETGQYFSNRNTGKFIILLNPFKPYKVVIEVEGYEPQKIMLKAAAVEREEQKLEIKLIKNHEQ